MIWTIIDWTVVVAWLFAVWFCIFGWRVIYLGFMRWVLDFESKLIALRESLAECQGEDIPDEVPANDCAD